MGNFLTSFYSAGSWGDSPAPEPWLSVDIHDSDFATVGYAPAPSGLGRFYLGFQPRDYFEDPAASEPVDNSAEAVAFSAWASAALSVSIEPAALLAVMAEEGIDEPLDVFVEETTERFLGLAGLNLPPALRGTD